MFPSFCLEQLHIFNLSVWIHMRWAHVPLSVQQINKSSYLIYSLTEVWDSSLHSVLLLLQPSVLLDYFRWFTPLCVIEQMRTLLSWTEARSLPLNTTRVYMGHVLQHYPTTGWMWINANDFKSPLCWSTELNLWQMFNCLMCWGLHVCLWLKGLLHLSQLEWNDYFC